MDDDRHAADDERGDARQGGGERRGGCHADDERSDGGGEPADVTRQEGDDERRGGRLPEPLVAVLADPAEGRTRLPYLLGMLDGDEVHRRLAAATAVCLVVEEYPDLLGYAVERLVDRLDGDEPVEVAHALDYLAARRPREVDEAVADLADAAEERARRRMYRTGAGFARNEYLAPTEGDRGVGRTRVAGGAVDDDPRRVYTGDGEREDGPDDGADGESSDRGEESVDGDGDADRPGTQALTRGTLASVGKRLAPVIEASRFDEVDVLTDRTAGRYADRYRAAATLDDEEYAVAIAVYPLPAENRASFVTVFRAAMEDWTAVDDHGGVLDVYDWGVRPRPWAMIEYAETTLADREADPPDPIGTVLALTDAVGHTHRHGAVHGAVDPGNVAYYGNLLDADERERPLLSNHALWTIAGWPAGGVDPRYAAPEHFDDDYGRVDHATDVYGLGMVLYRLCTGGHPYVPDAARTAVDASAVRDRVLSDESPVTAGGDLPAPLAQVVRKATATRKLKRYETVNQLASELGGVIDGA